MGSSAFEQLSGAGSSMKQTVQSVGHGFSPGEVLRHNGQYWLRALADTGCNAEALGVVESATADAFTICFAGAISTQGMSLTNGLSYFLSGTVAGALTNEAPLTTGSIKKCILVTTNTGEAIVVNYIGAVNGIDLGNLVELSEISPVGMIVPFGGSDSTTVPVGWILCQGQQFSQLDYPKLATLLGDNFGAIDGVMHKLPDLRGKSPVGVNTDSSLYSTRNIGDVGGEEKHFLTVGEMPSHNHAARYEAYLDEYGNDNNRHLTIDNKAYGPIANQPCFSSGCSLNSCSQMVGHGPMITNDWAHYCNDGNGDDNDLGRAYKSSITDPIGGGGAHNNMHPYLAMNYIIRAQSTANASFIDVNLSNLADVDTSQNTYSGASGASSCVKLLCNQPLHGDSLIYDSSINKWKSTFRTNKNYFINGNLDIWQRATSMQDAGGYSDSLYGSKTWQADRWGVYRVGTGRFNVHRVANVPSSSNVATGELGAGAKYSLSLSCSTPEVNSPAATYSGIQYHMEGPDFQPLFMSGAMTLTFWVRMSTSGEYSVAFRNQSWTRSLVAPYTITSPNTWQKIKITVPTPVWEPDEWDFEPADQTANNGIGLRVWFGNHVGDAIKINRSDANQWIAGNAIGIVGQQSNAQVVGNTMLLTQMKLEEGTVATPFVTDSYSVELEKCKRYFEKSYAQDVAIGTVTHNGRCIQDDWVIAPIAHFEHRFSVEKVRRPEVKIFNPYDGMMDWYAMIHREAGSDMNQHVSAVHRDTKGIQAISRYRTVDDPDGHTHNLMTGYKNKITFHYAASSELGGGDGSAN